MTHDSLPLKGASRGTNGNFILTSFEAQAESADPAKEPPVTAGVEWGKVVGARAVQGGIGKGSVRESLHHETEIDLTKTYEDGKVSWKEKPDWKDGAPQPLSGENQVTYFYRTIKVQTARYFRLTLGSDGGMQVWLNGAKVQSGKVFRRVAPAPDEPLVRLKSGENRLLLKVHHGSGEYGFLFAPSKQPVTNHPVEFTMAAADYSQSDFPRESGAGRQGGDGLGGRWPGRKTARQPAGRSSLRQTRSRSRAARA